MKKILSFLILTVFSVILIQTASAQVLVDTTKTGGLADLTDTVAKEARFGKIELVDVIAQIIKIALGLLATIFLILTIIAGFKWMTAQGNEEEIKKAQGTIKTAIIGLVIVLMSYAITYFIFRYLPFGGASGPQGGTSG